MTADRADVVVVGGGLAGLTAAVRAAELGLSAVVLEQGSDMQYACNSRVAGGVFHVVFTDITSPAATLRAAIERVTGGELDAAQADAIAANGGRLVAWLAEKGAKYMSQGADWQTYILDPPRRRVAGQDWRDRGPDRLLAGLEARLLQLGGQLVRGARARKLVMDGRRVAGVEAEVDGAARRLATGAVVIADGGFQADLELLGRMVRRPADVKQRGAATGRGDGLRMAEAIGARITPLKRFYGHILCRDAMTSDRVWPYPELDALATHGVLVDKSGRRPTDEGVGGVALTNAIAQLPDPLGATLIFDARIWDGPGRSARIPANPSLADAGGTVHSAATLAGLAAEAGIDAAGLEATIAAHNAALADGTMAHLTPPRTTSRVKPMPIATAPFMAIPVVAGITYTMGGIAIDGSCRVLHQDGSPVAGLYAAGSTTGGLEGGAHAAYVGGLAKAGVQGLVAAEAVAAARRSPA